MFKLFKYNGLHKVIRVSTIKIVMKCALGSLAVVEILTNFFKTHLDVMNFERVFTGNGRMCEI